MLKISLNPIMASILSQRLPILTLSGLNSIGSNVMSKMSYSSKPVGVSLDPYVDPKYSYSFGRSTGSLMYKTLSQGLQEVVDENPDRIAIISDHQSIRKTFFQFNQDVNKLSRSLIDTIGLEKGDVAGCWSTNLYEYFVVQHALARIGAINCSLSPLYKQSELDYALKKGTFKALFMPKKESRQSAVNDYHSILSSIDLSDKMLQNVIFFEGNAESFDTKKMKKSLNTHSFNELISDSIDGSRLPDEILSRVDPEDAVCIFWTSGTTGKPKGATLNHYSIINNVMILAHNKKEIKLEDEIRLCIPLPLFHVFAGMIGVYLFSVLPQTVILPDHKYSAKSTVEAISKHKCTDVWLVPAMIVDVNNYIKKRSPKSSDSNQMDGKKFFKSEIDTSSLRIIGSGAAPCPVEVVKEAQELFPSLELLTIGYGATEVSAVATYPNKNIPQSMMNDTCGQVLDFVEVKIIDPKNDQIVPLGETGELCVRGHNVMMGYLDEPEKTAETIKDGWYFTGDLATLDSKGLVRIVGRTKELIIRGGSNIYPREIEELLHEHPQVLDVAVCGVPHPKLGEEVCAWVMLTDPKANVTAEDIKNFCRDKISYYKVPQYVIFVQEFPTTASGKFQKFVMTEKSIEILGLNDPNTKKSQKIEDKIIN